LILTALELPDVQRSWFPYVPPIVGTIGSGETPAATAWATVRTSARWRRRPRGAGRDTPASNSSRLPDPARLWPAKTVRVLPAARGDPDPGWPRQL